MARGGDFDPVYVREQRRRVPPVSWQSLSAMTGASVDALRRVCDATYAPPDLAEAAARTGPQFSGRERRPMAWTAPPPRPDLAPPCSNAISLPTPAIARPTPLGQAAPAPKYPRGFRTLPIEEVDDLDAQISLVAGDTMPAAATVARAIVAAAKVTGEDPQLVADRNRYGLRFRSPVFAALRAKFPGASASALGRMVGLTNPTGQLNSAKLSAWWRDVGDRATEAALTVIEASQ
jgi:hypothetical protein